MATFARLRLRLGLLSAGAAIGHAQPYTIATFAGGSPLPTPAIAITAPIGPPKGIATDPAGNLYFIGHNVVFKMDTRGFLTRSAGNSRPGYSGDGGPATSAEVNMPA